MQFDKKILVIFFVLIGIFFVSLLPGSASAASQNSFVTIVNPVRGSEFWSLKDQKPVTNVQNAYQIVSQNGEAATWLLRFDALNDKQIVSQAKNFNPDQEIGLFLEITPSLAQKAGVAYQQGPSWHAPGSVFLTGYTLQDRYKLIDTAVARFKEVFGKNPRSVGAWWIDASSLTYLKDKYQVSAAMIVADQYSTDNYQIWGAWWSTPYFPSKVNVLMPAATDDKKLGVAVIQWANRDPYNAFGSSVFDSTYSVQANDYVPYHNLKTDYFKNLLSIFLNRPDNQIGQVTVGLENDFSWSKFGNEYKNQLDYIAQLAKSGQAHDVTMADFASQWQSQGGKNSPTYITAKNPLGGNGEVVWYMSPYYRVGWFYTDKGSVIRDMRLYFDSKEEPCLKDMCKTLQFAYTDSKALDEVAFGDNWTIDSGQISDITVSSVQDGVKITYKNKVGIMRTIQFTPHDVSIDGKSQAVSEAIINAVTANQQNNHAIEPTITNVQFPSAQLTKEFALFVLFVLLVLFLPGRATLKVFSRMNAIPFAFALEMTAGIAQFTILGYVFGLLHMGVLYAAPLVIFGIWGLWKYKVSSFTFHISRNTVVAVLLIIVGSTFVSLSVIKSGLPFSYGLGFWGPNGHDAIWHLSLIEALSKGVPPQNFTFAGTTLANYHYFFDLFVAQIANITHLSNLDLLFRFVPVLLALLIGFLVYGLVLKISGSKLASIIAVFVTYFGSSFGWIITYARMKEFGGETTFWANQAGSLLLNPPFASSVVLLLAGLLLLHDWLEDRTKKAWIPIILVLGVIIEFKVYAALILFGGLCYIAIIEAVRNKKFDLFVLSVLLVLSNAVLFIANTTNSQGLLFFSPFWIINSMIDAPDRLGWQRLAITRNSGSPIKFLVAETTGLVLFIFGNLGTRFVGLLAAWQKRRLMLGANIYSLLAIGSLVGLIFPLLFIQKTTSWNSIQTFYYTLTFFSIFAGIALAQFYNKSKTLGTILIALFIVLTLPGDYFVLQTYLPNRAPARLSYAELDALNFLKNQPQGTVMTYPFSDKDFAKFADPRPLFAYTTTAYVSAFSGHPVYLEDKMNNEIIGVDDLSRMVGQQEFFKNQNPSFIKNFISQNKISYIYLPKYYKESLDESAYGVKNIFSNDEVTLYRVQ